MDDPLVPWRQYLRSRIGLCLNASLLPGVRYGEAVKFASEPDVGNEELLERFQKSYAEAREVSSVPQACGRGCWEGRALFAPSPAHSG